MNFVFTLGDNAAQRVCAIFSGQPLTAHWGVADPAKASGTPRVIEAAFGDAVATLWVNVALEVELCQRPYRQFGFGEMPRSCPNHGHNRPISAHFQGVASFRASVTILVRRLERRSTRRREVPLVRHAKRGSPVLRLPSLMFVETELLVVQRNQRVLSMPKMHPA
jgi:hypothetical protein